MKAQAGEEVSPEELKQKTEELQNEAINLFKDLYKDGGESSGSSDQPKELNVIKDLLLCILSTITESSRRGGLLHEILEVEY